MLTVDEIKKKWKPILEHEELVPIKDPHKRRITAIMLENTQRALAQAASQGDRQVLVEDPIPANFMGASSSTAGAGGIDTFDPVLISLVRRTVPNLMAYEVMGVQPMTG